MINTKTDRDMKAWDLMVNDLVYYIGDGEPSVRFVNEITGLHQVYLWSDKFDASSWILVGEKYIKPIPLTAEILEKNSINYKVGLGGLFMINLDGLNCSIQFNIIHYVHELQHALRLIGSDDLANNFKV